MSGFGYIPDPYRESDLLFGSVGVGAAPEVDEIELVEYAPPILNQRWTSACVGFSVARWLYIALSASGQTPAEPFSVLYPYGVGRASHSRPGRPLADNGTYISNSVDECRASGIPPESTWPFVPDARERAMDMGEPIDVARINARPPLSAERDAFDVRGFDRYRIVSVGDRMLDEIDAALYAKSPVVFGIMLKRSFTGAGEFVDDMDGDFMGGHAMVIRGRRRRNGSRYYGLDNSWGTGFGVKGRTWIHERLMKRAIDIHAALPKAA